MTLPIPLCATLRKYLYKHYDTSWGVWCQKKPPTLGFRWIPMHTVCCLTDVDCNCLISLATFAGLKCSKLVSKLIYLAALILGSSSASRTMYYLPEMLNVHEYTTVVHICMAESTCTYQPIWVTVRTYPLEVSAKVQKFKLTSGAYKLANTRCRRVPYWMIGELYIYTPP